MAIQDCEDFPYQVVYTGISSPIRSLLAIFARRTSMRQTRKSQLALGEARIEDIKLDHKSCDDIPTVLLGLQHHPTDVNLLWDAMRCLLRELGHAAKKYEIVGWRQWRHLTKEVKRCFNKVRSTRRAKSRPDRVEAYIERCRHLVGRAEESLKESEQADVAQSGMIQSLIAHAWRQIDQVDRRLLKGETVAHDEKVFSIFEEHTRWSRRARRAVRWSSEFPCAWWKTNSSSSFATR